MKQGILLITISLSITAITSTPQRRHFRHNRENVWKRSKSDPPLKTTMKTMEKIVAGVFSGPHDFVSFSRLLYNAIMLSGLLDLRISGSRDDIVSFTRWVSLAYLKAPAVVLVEQRGAHGGTCVLDQPLLPNRIFECNLYCHNPEVLAEKYEKYRIAMEVAQTGQLGMDIGRRLELTRK
ncbi:hypothetical protein ACFXTO_025989 [Malus domestica]